MPVLIGSQGKPQLFWKNFPGGSKGYRFYQGDKFSGYAAVAQGINDPSKKLRMVQKIQIACDGPAADLGV